VAKVLMLSLVFGPDTVSTANMMTDIAHGLHEKGHNVTVVTSMPHYNPSQTVLSNPKYRTKLPTLFTDVTEDGVRVIRVYMPLKGKKVWRRALDYIWFQTITLFVAFSKVNRDDVDVVYIPSPPITLGINGYILKKLLNAKMIYDVRELWPDMPVRMGLFQNKLLIRLVYAIEGFVYRNSYAITSIARSFIDSLAERGVPRDKMFFTPNFVDVEWLMPHPKVNGFSIPHQLHDKFVVLYAGNIGLSQGLEIIVDVAREFAADKQVIFLVVGDGASRRTLEETVEHSGLQNILMLPYQPYEQVPEVYATSDICISPMKYGYSYDTVPSKIYTAMAAGRPVVAAAEADTETAALLRESKGGIVVTPESVPEMVEAIRQLRNSSKVSHQMGKNARQWVVDNYSKKAVIATYDQVMRHVTRSENL